MIVVGDFNCPPGSEPYWILTEERSHPTALHNALAATEGGTYHAFTGTPRAGRIDWILVSRDMDPAEAAVDRSQPHGRYPSDHFPVAATLRLSAAWQPHW